MIRLKNNVLPVWFQWDGDEESMKRALQTIVEDIQMNGFKHYTTYVDVWDETAEEDKNWDGETTVTLTPNDTPTEASPPQTEATESKPKQSKPAKKNTGLPQGGTPNMNKFAMEGSNKTTTKSTKTAS